MTREEIVEELKDNMARASAMIDRAQFVLDKNRHQMTEDTAWELQANLDKRRFQLELDRIQINQLLLTK